MLCCFIVWRAWALCSLDAPGQGSQVRYGCQAQPTLFLLHSQGFLWATAQDVREVVQLLAAICKVLKAAILAPRWSLTVTCGSHQLLPIVVAVMVRAGKVAFEFFQPTLPGGAFQYMTLPENKEEEELFNKLMTTFTKTMDVGIAKLHVGVDAVAGQRALLARWLADLAAMSACALAYIANAPCYKVVVVAVAVARA